MLDGKAAALSTSDGGGFVLGELEFSDLLLAHVADGQVDDAVQAHDVFGRYLGRVGKHVVLEGAVLLLAVPRVPDDELGRKSVLVHHR